MQSGCDAEWLDEYIQYVDGQLWSCSGRLRLKLRRECVAVWPVEHVVHVHLRLWECGVQLRLTQRSE